MAGKRSLDRLFDMERQGKEIVKEYDDLQIQKPKKEENKPEQSKPKRTDPAKPRPKPVPKIQNEEELRSTEIFDINTEGVVIPARKQRGQSEEYTCISVYVTKKEAQLLEENSAKHGMTKSNYMRLFILNGN